MINDFPAVWNALIKDWTEITLPDGSDGRKIAYQCRLPAGSYVVAGNKMRVETAAHADVVREALAKTLDRALGGQQ